MSKTRNKASGWKKESWGLNKRLSRKNVIFFFLLQTQIDVAVINFQKTYHTKFPFKLIIICKG